jgi:hypothetical protein
MYVRKKMDVSGAAVPRILMAEAGWLIHWLNWVKKEPAMKEPKKTVTTCTST